MLARITLLILLMAPSFLIAEELTCKAKEAERSWANSLREVVVNTDTRKVGIRYSNDRKLRFVPLLHSEKSRFYFNRPHNSKGKFTAYQLFSLGSDWRVLSVGLTDLNGVPILRAGGINPVFGCTKKS